MNSMFWRFALVVSMLFAFQIGCGQAPKPDKPRPLVDSDGDGYPAIRHGGRDCDDANPKINPLVPEIQNNGKDENCNGQIDELTVSTGHWRLTTPGQKEAAWHIDIRTDESTGVQYIRCIQFSFQLKSTKSNTIFKLTQWQSHLPSGHIKIEKIGTKTQFKWKYDRAEDTVKTEFTGEFLDTNNDGIGDTIKGKLTLQDIDPKVLAREVLDFNGKLEKPLASDALTSKFCERCYSDVTCVAEKQ